jgi:hypothetical protein
MNKKENQMAKAGQTMGQERDEVGLTAKADEIVSVPWVALDRGDTRAILISERSARFDRRMPSLPPIEEAPVVDVGAFGPMPIEWTWDLVHARLLSVDAIARQLPRVRLPAVYRSFLGELQPQDAVPGRQRVLTDEHTKRLDWTMTKLHAWSEIDRAVLMGVMSGRSLNKIVKIIAGIVARRGGEALQRSAVHKRYRRNTTAMAEDWNREGVPVDADTRECWLNVASKKI